MAVRPVYAVKSSAPFYSVFSAEFSWAGGFALSQSRKNVSAMHACFEERYPGKKALEISSKSEVPAGAAASALNLRLFVPSKARSFPVECCYQAAKVFAGGGPYDDLLTAAPKDAKRDARLSASGRLVCFRFEGTDYPLEPGVGFYDFIYIRALTENPDAANELLGFDAFTDIAFNPEKSRNCQARSAAVFVGLHCAGKLGCLASYDEFMRTVNEEAQRRPEPVSAAGTAAPKQPVSPAPAVPKAGDRIVHKAFGEGVVTAVTASGLRIDFKSVGEKTLSAEWVMKNCVIVKE